MNDDFFFVFVSLENFSFKLKSHTIKHSDTRIGLFVNRIFLKYGHIE